MIAADLHSYALDTVHRISFIAGGLLVAAGLVAIIVVLVVRYRADVADIDTKLRAQGHVPPETDPEKTGWVPRVVDDEPQGRHTLRVDGAVWVRDILAREGVTV